MSALGNLLGGVWLSWLGVGTGVVPKVRVPFWHLADTSYKMYITPLRGPRVSFSFPFGSPLFLLTLNPKGRDSLQDLEESGVQLRCDVWEVTGRG